MMMHPDNSNMEKNPNNKGIAQFEQDLYSFTEIYHLLLICPNIMTWNWWTLIIIKLQNNKIFPQTGIMSIKRLLNKKFQNACALFPNSLFLNQFYSRSSIFS